MNEAINTSRRDFCQRSARWLAFLGIAGTSAWLIRRDNDGDCPNFRSAARENGTVPLGRCEGCDLLARCNFADARRARHEIGDCPDFRVGCEAATTQMGLSPLPAEEP